MSFEPRFPAVIDSTMLAAFKACPKKFYWEYILRLRPKGTSIHLVAGGAFAKGIEVARKAYYDLGASEQAALEAGISAALKAYDISLEVSADHPKSPRAITEALIGYLDKWPFSTDYLRPVKQAGRHWIEFTFALPIPFQHPQTLQPLMYAGKCDMIGVFNSTVFTVDEKTCSSMGEKWSRQFDMRSQFMGYNWAAREHGFNVAGTIVRGIKLLKTEQDFAETIIMHGEHKINMWHKQMQRDIARMLECWRTGIWDYDLADACTAYGGCPFRILDESTTPESYFDVHFQENTWSPLAAEEGE